MERGSTHFNCSRRRRSVVVVFLGAFLMILRADRSFVRSLANEVGAAGASGFYTAPAAAAPSSCRRASARSSSAGLRSNESGRKT